MRQVTIIRTIKTFDEFNKEDQAKILDNLRDLNTSHSWWDDNYEDYKSLLTELGFYDINIAFSGFCSQGDGASFTAKFNHEHYNVEVLESFKKDYVGLFSDEAQVNFQRVLEAIDLISKCIDEDKIVYNEYDLETSFNIGRINSHYCHNGTISADHSSVRIFARGLSVEIYVSLEKEYDYLQSDEAIKETIECNDYEFYTDTLGIA